MTHDPDEGFMPDTPRKPRPRVKLRPVPRAADKADMDARMRQIVADIAARYGPYPRYRGRGR